MSRGKERRAARRAARAVFREAADDLGVSRIELARLLRDDDKEAWAAVAVVAKDEAPELDIGALIELIMAIIEIIMRLFA